MKGETGSTDRVRIIGALTGPLLELLLAMVGHAEVMLDLSEVHEADSDAVRLLAQLAPDQYKLIACPKWLAVRVRDGAAAPAERASSRKGRLRGVRQAAILRRGAVASDVAGEAR
jgi:hypothetical protein